jgi:hypothetical protein
MDGPFIGTEAVAAGQVSRRALRSRHRAIYRNVYLANDLVLTPTSRAVAAWLWSDRQATVSNTGSTQSNAPTTSTGMLNCWPAGG